MKIKTNRTLAIVTGISGLLSSAASFATTYGCGGIFLNYANNIQTGVRAYGNVSGEVNCLCDIIYSSSTRLGEVRVLDDGNLKKVETTVLGSESTWVEQWCGLINI